MRSIMIAALAAIFLLPVSAQASRAPVGGAVQQFCGDRYGACGGASVSPVNTRVAKRKSARFAWRRAAKGVIRLTRVGAQPLALGRVAIIEAREAPGIVDHPIGCPRRSFCGCGTSLYLLGRAVAQGGLAIASNWLGFPRAEAAPGMAAARRGHVFAIVKVLPGNRVLAYDPNSGRHQTRVHIRSLRGYTVVNPRGANRYASAG